MEEFHRIRRLPPYVFEQVNRAKAAARNARRRHHRSRHGQSGPAGARSMSSTSSKETLGKPRTDRYSSSRGIPGLRRAQAAYYARRFGVKLNPDTQVVATLGSKEGFANMAQAITAPGDVVLVPEPELSDPRLRLPDGGRRDPLGAGRSRRRTSSARSSARSSIRSRSRSRWWSAIRRTRPRYVADLDFYKDLVAVREEARHLHPVRSRLCRGLFRQQSAAVGAAGAGRDRRRGRVHLDVEDLSRCPAGAWALRSATSASSRRWRG